MTQVAPWQHTEQHFTSAAIAAPAATNAKAIEMMIARMSAPSFVIVIIVVIAAALVEPTVDAGKLFFQLGDAGGESGDFSLHYLN
jgi:hypothetical protein